MKLDFKTILPFRNLLTVICYVRRICPGARFNSFFFSDKAIRVLFFSLWVGRSVISSDWLWKNKPSRLEQSQSREIADRNWIWKYWDYGAGCKILSWGCHFWYIITTLKYILLGQGHKVKIAVKIVLILNYSYCWL